MGNQTRIIKIVRSKTHKTFFPLKPVRNLVSIPLSPVGFYLDGFLSVNTFSGTVSFQGVSGVPTGDYDLETATRVGAGVGGGVLLDFIPVSDT